MPYLIDKKNKCIYKKNLDGSRGKKVGCTKGSLKKYITAIHANVKECKEMKKETLKEMVQRIIKEETISPVEKEISYMTGARDIKVHYFIHDNNLNDVDILTDLKTKN